MRRPWREGARIETPALSRGAGDQGSRVGFRGSRVQLHKASKVTPHSQPSGNGVNRAATAARRVRTTVRGVYVAGVLLDPLRHFLVAHSYPAHLLPNVRVARTLSARVKISSARARKSLASNRKLSIIAAGSKPESMPASTPHQCRKVRPVADVAIKRRDTWLARRGRAPWRTL